MNRKIFLLSVIIFLFSCDNPSKSSQQPTQTNSLQPFSVTLLGDTSFGESYQQKIEQSGGKNILKTKGYDYPITKFTDFLASSDLIIANLETPITNLKNSPHMGKKGYLHWSDTIKTPLILKKHNITALSLANNHTLDYGAEGLKQTLDVLEKNNLTGFGAGLNQQLAAKPFHHKKIVNNQLFHLIVVAGFEYNKRYDEHYQFYAKEDKSGVNLWRLTTAKQQIESIKNQYPNAFIVAFPHWGKNYAWKTKQQTKLAHTIIDAGADLIIGHGAHMLQEIEKYKEKWIVYSLGNFIFNSPGRYKKKHVDPFSLVAKLDISYKNSLIQKTLNLYPIFSDNKISNYQPHFVTNSQFKNTKKLLLSHNRALSKLNVHNDSFGRHFKLIID